MEDIKEVVVDNTPTRGLRGEIGVASAAKTLKKLWSASGQVISLKRFARQLTKDGNAIANEWRANKRGAKNEKRNDKNAQRVIAERLATKAAKRKTGKK